VPVIVAAQRTCIVTPDLAGPTRNGGIGTHCLQLARLLARRGDAVTILHTGHLDDPDHAAWQDHYRRDPGADLVLLDALTGPEHEVPVLPLTERHTLAHRVDRWLRVQAFDEVHFQDWQGNGAVATRAKRAGAAHARTRLIVTAHGSSEWIREGMQEFPAEGREGLIDDALERTAVACADVLVCPSRAMHAWLGTHGWQIPADTRVMPYLYEDAAPAAAPRAIAAGAIEELVFFGRLETRKGLEPFLGALETLASQRDFLADSSRPIRVHFVGKPHATRLGPAESAIEETRRRCGPRFTVEVHPALDHAGALAFLRAHPGALVVMPSLADNLPFAVIEALALGQPLLAADRGGIPELVGSRDHLVEPTASALAARIVQIAHTGLRACSTTYSPEGARAAWTALLDSRSGGTASGLPSSGSAATQAGGSPTIRDGAPLRVSVCVPHYNQIAGLADVLAALAAQSKAPAEVIVIDDGSAAGHRPAWDELSARYAARGWKFLVQANAGPAAARNTAAAHATGDALLFCDADNRPHPGMLARLATAMQSTGADIVTCGFEAYRADAAGAWSSQPDFRFSPIGDAPELAVLENFLGDVNFIVRRAVFTDLGGFDGTNVDASEDWEFLLRASCAGRTLATVPESLFDYRIAAASHARRHSERSSAAAVWRTLPDAERARYLRLIQAARGTFDRLPGLLRALNQAEARSHATAQHAGNLQEQLNTTAAHVDHLARAQEATAQHARNVEAAVTQVREELKQAHDLQAATRSALEESEHRVAALTAEKHALESARDTALGQVNQLSERAARLSTTIHELKHEILRRNGKIHTLEQSFSWRVTVPLRWLRRKFIDPRRRQPAANASSLILPEIAPPAPPCSAPGLYGLPHSVDEPRSWTLAPRKHLLRGWVFHPGGNELRGIRVVLGRRVIEGVYGLKRLDVAASVRNMPQAEFCGWRIDAELHETDTELELQALDESGIWLPFFRTGLRVGTDLGPTDLTRYEEWIKVYDTLSPETLASQRERAARLAQPPRFSIVAPVFNTPERWLRRMIDSVREQTYPHWELCLADDASTEPHVHRILAEAAAADPRIRVASRTTNGHISAASNSALELATGEFVGLLDHDDELAPHALHEVSLVIARRPAADLIYSDEDKIDEDGRRFEPYFKPDWNPDLFLGQNYLSHFSVYRKALVREVGGFRVGYEGSQDWDLALRVTARSAADRIVHIPKVLYHWRAIAGSTALELSEKSYPVEAARRALTDHFAAAGIAARLEPVPGGHWRVVYPVPQPPPLVSIIIPTRNGLEHLRRCVESIRAHTDYPRYEIIIVDNGSDDPATLAWLQQTASDMIRVLPYPGPFNYSAINNTAVRAARGEIVALLNNDLEVITPGWLTEMVAHTCREGIGCVGAMLYFPNDHIQHAGVVLGVGGVAGHAFRDFPRGTEGVFNRARLVQEFSAVTAACLVVRRSIYLSVGGLDETDLAIAFNDIDFCLKVRRAGFRNLWTPFAELYHHESASRGADDTPEKRTRFDREVEVMLRRWGSELGADPAYNPNLTLERNDFSLAIPPRPARN
jgi:glycosyltransferase involved in cell wall biosynthesis